MPDSTHHLARSLLAWYDRERRDLPWRAPPGVSADPYRVWLSEIMLQQTTAAVVAPYFDAFVARWPRIEELAAADLDAVLHVWQGLGYYARARNLHACARIIAARHGGRFPEDEAALRPLPGIGAYTAAAIAAIAFGERATPVDGNVLRVVARLHAIEEPLPRARRKIATLARALTPERRTGDFAQAMMDLGATLCSPRRPRCPECPWRRHCAGYAAGSPQLYPQRAEKAEKPLRRGVVFWAEREDGAVLVRRRTDGGIARRNDGISLDILANRGMAGRRSGAPTAAGRALVLAAAGRAPHLHALSSGADRARGPCRRRHRARRRNVVRATGLARLALPTLMKKIARMAMSASGPPYPAVGPARSDVEAGALSATASRRRRPAR